MRIKFWFCLIWVFGIEASSDNDSTDDYNHHVGALEGKNKQNESSTKCWMSVGAPELFRVMEKVDLTYAAARKDAQKYLSNTDFVERMLQNLVHNGVAQRELFKERPADKPWIPSGINLGGMCMMRMPYSVLFFHRMKLRNNTYFQISNLDNDIENMVLRANFSLNDLYLRGAYDRSMTDKDPAALIYTPSFGELEILMEGVEYAIEGRYRLITNRLVIELIVSTLDTKNIKLTYDNSNKTDPPIWIEKKHMGEFISRLKTDLDKWVQDFFNDYLIHEDLSSVPSITKLQEYDQQKAIQLAVFTENALLMMNKKIRNIGGDSMRLPSFKTITAYGVTMKIFDGALRGLDTMYRKSVATTALKTNNYRNVDAIIGFSNLKVSYKYEVNFPPAPKSPPALTGVLTMSTKEVTAHLTLGLINEPEVMDLDIDFINRMGPEAITVEGAANLLISNFKHVLRHEIVSIMSHALTYGIGMLKTLPRCEPFVPGILKKKNKTAVVGSDKDPSSSEYHSDLSGKSSSDEQSEVLRQGKKKRKKSVGRGLKG